MREKLEKIVAAYGELEAKMGDPAVVSNQSEYNLPRITQTRVSWHALPRNTSVSWTIWRLLRKCSAMPT